jgi:predicted  nucleic acid-binding Zn-ribbon protein
MEMGINIEELRETLEARKDDMLNNRALTNELIVDDIMVELGYNKKRDANVKRLYSGQIDWEIKTDDKRRMAVKVFALGEVIDPEEVKQTMDMCKEKRYSILLITNGQAITVCRYSKETISYIEVSDIDMTQDLSEDNLNLLEAISKSTFNLDYIDNLLKSVVVTYDDVMEVYTEHKSDFLRNLITWVKAKITDAANADTACKEFIETLISTDKQSIETEQAENLIDSAEIESLNEQLNDKDATIAELQQAIKNVTKQYEETEIAFENFRTEVENSKTVESESIDNTENIEELKKDIETLENTNETLSNENEVIKSENETLKNDAESIKIENEALKNESVKLKEELEATKSELEAVRTEKETIENSENKIRVSLEKPAENSEEVDKDVLKSYEEQIRKLTVKISELEETNKSLSEQLKDANDTINNISGSERDKAIELLNIIEDNDNMPRHYVAVVNKELIQYEELHTFVGRALQMLYELKNYEANQYIFNGDIFKLNATPKYNDLMLGTKTYDIVVDNMTEDEALNKLRIIFNHFDDVIFECKKIGHKVDKVEKEVPVENIREKEVEATNEDYIDLDGGNEQVENNIEANDIFGQPESFGENTEIESIGQPFENVEQQFENIGQNENIEYSQQLDEQYIEENNNIQSTLVVGQLLCIDQLIWTEENIQFNNIKYIGTNSVTFAINVNSQKYFDSLLCKCIDAIMVIAAYNGNRNIITQLKSTDLSLVNNFIKLYSEDLYKGYPRINGTRYAAVGIENVQQVATVLLDICNEMKIDTTEIFIYFDAVTDSQFILDNYAFAEQSIQLNENVVYNNHEEINSGIAIIRGDMLNSMVVTKNSLSMHKEIFIKALAIKTKYLAKVLNTQEDVAGAIKEILEHAHEAGAIVNVNAIGNLVGTHYKIISNNRAEVSEQCYEIQCSHGTFYCSAMEEWQVTHSLIKIHTTIFNDTAIAVKNQISLDAVKFYREQFMTSEPSLALAVKSFIDYLGSCIK